jgi:hypothetical protein
MDGATRCNADKPTFSQKCVGGTWTDIIDCSTLGGGITCDNGICRTPLGDDDETEYILEGDACKSDPDCKNANKYCFKLEGAEDGICPALLRSAGRRRFVPRRLQLLHHRNA